MIVLNNNKTITDNDNNVKLLKNSQPHIKCTECGGCDFTRSGKNNSRVISTKPRVVIQVQRWICRNPECRKYNFSTMDIFRRNI
jgi:hypothetical protein